MSTFPLPNTSPPVSVQLTADISQDQLLSFPAFKDWVSTLQHSLSLQHTDKNHAFHSSPYTLRKIDVQSVDFFRSGRLGFVKLRAEVTNDDGEKLPGSIFLRGGSVAMLVILQPDDTPEESEDEKYVIMTIQPRIPAGSLSMAEIPAGMIDDSGTFAGAAAKEIQEELGMDIPQDSLIDMTELALPDTTKTTGERLRAATYTSAGGSDEFLPIFLHQRRVPREQLKSWEGKLTGLRDHGEKITLKLVKLNDLWKEGGRDVKALAALAFYNGLRREGKLRK